VFGNRARHPVPSRSVLILSLIVLGSLLGGSLSGCAAAPAAPTLKIVSPADGATVKGPQVKVEASVQGFKLVPAGSAVANGEGHLHFFVDVPSSTVAVGQAIPPTESNHAIVHAGKEPLTSRELELSPGTHTITVVVGDSSHVALGTPAPQSITVHVE
jgi:hypothetical protein